MGPTVLRAKPRFKNVWAFPNYFPFSFSFLFSDKKIKTKTEYSYTITQKFGEDIETLEDKTIYSYDSNGNQIETSYYNSEGDLDLKRRPQGKSPNPVFRYNPEVEQEAIRILDRQTYNHYID